MKMKQYPDTVSIPTPMYTPRLRGVQSRGPHGLGALGENLRVRISRVDYDVVEKVAHELGMKKADFVRWSAIEVAKALTALPD